MFHQILITCLLIPRRSGKLRIQSIVSMDSLVVRNKVGGRGQALPLLRLRERFVLVASESRSYHAITHLASKVRLCQIVNLMLSNICAFFVNDPFLAIDCINNVESGSLVGLSRIVRPLSVHLRQDFNKFVLFSKGAFASF
jgi:hypothetical protein